MSELALWTNGVHYCVAESAEEAELMQPTDPNDDLDDDEERHVFERIEEDAWIELHCYPGTYDVSEIGAGALIGMIAGRWVRLKGRGYLYTDGEFI